MTFFEAAQLITAMAAAIAALGAVFMSYRNGTKIQEVHLSINSRMDQLLFAAKTAARAEGAKQEQADAAAAKAKLSETG